MPKLNLRPATPADAAALARLHVAVWRETYGHLAPSSAVQALDESRRLTQWQTTLNAPPPTTTFLLEREEAREVVGLVSVGPATQAVFGAAGELRHLYLAASLRGGGHGARLLRAGLRALRAAGFSQAALAVVVENHAARGFYAQMGGREAARFVDQGPLWRSQNLVVLFDLPSLQVFQ